MPVKGVTEAYRMKRFALLASLPVLFPEPAIWSNVGRCHDHTQAVLAHGVWHVNLSILPPSHVVLLGKRWPFGVLVF